MPGQNSPFSASQPRSQSTFLSWNVFIAHFLKRMHGMDGSISIINAYPSICAGVEEQKMSISCFFCFFLASIVVVFGLQIKYPGKDILCKNNHK